MGYYFSQNYAISDKNNKEFAINKLLQTVQVE